MADLTVTAAQAAVVFPDNAEIYDFEAAETITAGQAVYINSSGKVATASAAIAGTAAFRGVALNGGAAGQAISVLKKGHIYGFDLSGLAYDAAVYLSDTGGALADAAGTVSKQVGIVVPLNDTGTLTKVLYVNADWS